MLFVRFPIRVLIPLVILTWMPRLSFVHAEDLTLSFNRNVLPVLERYCYDCHGNGEQEGSIALDQLNVDLINGADAESWHAVLDVLNAGDMPPEDEAQPNAAERRIMVDWMTRTLKNATAAHQETKPARAATSDKGAVLKYVK